MDIIRDPSSGGIIIHRVETGADLEIYVLTKKNRTSIVSILVTTHDRIKTRKKREWTGFDAYLFPVRILDLSII
jgi:hypothetical protein